MPILFALRYNSATVLNSKRNTSLTFKILVKRLDVNVKTYQRVLFRARIENILGIQACN